MSELCLSPNARRSLWQCYSLLLKLADQVEKNAAADSQPLPSAESAAAAKAKQLTRPGNDTSEAGLGQMAAEEPVDTTGKTQSRKRLPRQPRREETKRQPQDK